MKKKISYVVFSILLMLFISGCFEDPKPREWDVEKDKTWEVWSQGELLDFKDARGASCSHDKNTPENWCYISKAFIFKNGDTIVINPKLLQDQGLIKPGQTGVLYRYNRRHRDERSWHQWVIKEEANLVKQNTISIIKPEIKAKYIDIDSSKPKIETKYISHPWQRAFSNKPEYHKTVIVRLNNGYLTIAYLNDNNEWKLDINRNKTSSGSSLRNVRDWREID